MLVFQHCSGFLMWGQICIDLPVHISFYVRLCRPAILARKLLSSPFYLETIYSCHLIQTRTKHIFTSCQRNTEMSLSCYQVFLSKQSVLVVIGKKENGITALKNSDINLSYQRSESLAIIMEPSKYNFLQNHPFLRNFFSHWKAEKYLGWNCFFFVYVNRLCVCVCF